MNSTNGYNKLIGHRVELFRKAKAWSQAVLAKHAGIGQKTVCRIENGQVTHLSPSTIDAIATALGVTVGDLLGSVGAETTTSYPGPHSHLHEALDLIIEKNGEPWTEHILRSLLEMRGGDHR